MTFNCAKTAVEPLWKWNSRVIETEKAGQSEGNLRFPCKWFKIMENNNSQLIQQLYRRQGGFCPSSNFKLKIFKDRLAISKNLYKHDLVSHYGCVNAIEFSTEGNYLTSGWWLFALTLFVSFFPSSRCDLFAQKLFLVIHSIGCIAMKKVFLRL